VNVAGIQETGSSSAVNAGIEQDGSGTAAECPGPLRRTGQPMSELWHAMQLLSQVETNTEGITRVRARSSRVTVDALPPSNTTHQKVRFIYKLRS